VANGYVGFFRNSELVPLEINPVEIIDRRGRKVTPAGLEWGVANEHGTWWLTLRLDDSKLPLPYTIDPTATYRTSATAVTWPGTGTTTITIPAIQANELLVVQQSADLSAATFATAPTDAGGGNTWTKLANAAGTNISQVVSYKFAVAADSTINVTLTPPSNATVATVNVASLHVFKGLAVAAIATAQTAALATASRAITCPAITSVAGALPAAPELLICVLSAAADPLTNAYSAATGMAPWTYDAFDNTAATTAGNTIFSAEVTSPTALLPITSGNNIFNAPAGNKDQVATAMGFNTDATAPTVSSVTSTLASGSYKAGTVIPITVNFSEPVTVTGSPDPRPQHRPRPQRHLLLRLGHQRTGLQLHRAGRRHAGRRPRLCQHRLAGPRRRHHRRMGGGHARGVRGVPGADRRRRGGGVAGHPQPGYREQQNRYGKNGTKADFPCAKNGLRIAHDDSSPDAGLA